MRITLTNWCAIDHPPSARSRTGIDFEVNEFFLDRLAKYFSLAAQYLPGRNGGRRQPACKFLQIGSPQSSAANVSHCWLMLAQSMPAGGNVE